MSSRAKSVRRKGQREGGYTTFRRMRAIASWIKKDRVVERLESVMI